MNNSSLNVVDHMPCPYAISATFTTLLAVISLAAIIGNVLVIAAVYKVPYLRTSTNYYYVNMAVSDFLSCLITWPLYLTDEIITSRGSLIKGFVATASCKVGVFMRNVSHSVSILSLFLIAVDRFIATKYPLKVTLLTKKIRASLLLSSWVISIGYCFPTFLYAVIDKVGHESFCRLALAADKTMPLYLFAVILIIILYSAITILYLRIMSVLQRRLQPEDGKEDIVGNEQKRARHNRNVMKIFKSIVVAFFICWFLFCGYMILKIFFPELFLRDKCKLILGFAYYVFPLISTVVNPAILFSFSSNFRQALKEICPFFLGKFKPRWERRPVVPLQRNEYQIRPMAFQMIKQN